MLNQLINCQKFIFGNSTFISQTPASRLFSTLHDWLPVQFPFRSVLRLKICRIDFPVLIPVQNFYRDNIFCPDQASLFRMLAKKAGIRCCRGKPGKNLLRQKHTRPTFARHRRCLKFHQDPFRIRFVKCVLPFPAFFATEPRSWTSMESGDWVHFRASIFCCRLGR